MKPLLVFGIILSAIVLISIPSVTAQSESNTIPSWIKGVASFWIEGGINDAEFVEALEFLVDNNVIELGENVVVDNTIPQLQEENNMLKEKLDVSEANRVSQSQSDAAQHKKLYDEKDLKIKELNDRLDEKEAEWRQINLEKDAEIKELQVEIGELEGKNRYLEQQLK